MKQGRVSSAMVLSGDLYWSNRSALSATAWMTGSLRMRRGGWVDGRCGRPGRHLLAAFLATAAKLPSLLRALDANQCAARRPRAGRFRGMLDHRRFGPPGLRRGRFVPFRRPGLGSDYRYGAGGRVSVPAAVHAFGCLVRTVARLPDHGAVQLSPGPLAGAMVPPIGRTRLVMAPNNEMVVVPIKVVVEPCSQAPNPRRMR